MPTPPKAILGLAFIISLVCGASALAGAALFLMSGQWFSFGFEVSVALACFFGVLAGLGKFKDAPAITLMCTGGALFVGATLAEPYIASRMVGDALPATVVGGMSILPFALARLAAGLVMLGLAGAIVLLREPGRSLPLFFKGVAFGIPVVVALGALAVPGIRNAALGASVVLKLPLGIAAGVVLGALLSISGHCIINAFVAGQGRSEQNPGVTPSAA